MREDGVIDLTATDGQVVEAALAKSPAALRRIVDCHWDEVHRAAFLITGDAAASEDIAQETLVRAIRALDQFDKSRPLRPWINRIAANCAKDWVRAKGRRPEISVEAVAELADASPDAAADSIADALPADLLAALMRLDPDDRAAVVMRYLLGLSASEAGSELGLTAGALRTKTHRALSRLRSELKPEEALNG